MKPAGPFKIRYRGHITFISHYCLLLRTNHFQLLVRDAPRLVGGYASPRTDRSRKLVDDN